jgi:flagellar protein FlgJ
MEISGFGMINPADYLLSSAPAVRAPENFTEILERMRPANSGLENDSSEDGASVTGVSSETGTAAASFSGNRIDKNDKLYQLCLELETFLVKNIVNGMRNTVQKTGLVDDSFAGKMYEDMLYDEYSKEFAKNAGFGLAEMAYRQMTGL